MRSQYDSNERTQNFRTSTQFQQTPRGTNKPNIPIDTSRRSTTPSRIQERVSNSPLKVPLSNAINKATRGKQYDMERSTQSRYMGKSNRKDESPIISMARKMYYDEDSESQQMKSHPQTYSFIKKYFETMNLEVPLERFISKIMQEYQTLWGTQNAEKIFDDFTYKIAEIFGNEYVDLRELVRITKEDGMIGLILRIFKQIKSEQNTRSSNYVSFSQSPQILNINRSFSERLSENDSIVGIKNVVQEFMESMYQAMQAEIYEKFNVQMRRMVIKYRETQKILKKVNEKLNSYADVFDFEAKLKEKDKKYEAFIDELTKLKQKAVSELEKQKQTSTNERREKQRFAEENKRLKQNLEKFQNALLNKAMQSNSQNILLRQNSGLSRISQRPCQPLRTSQITNIEPFKITIDTHTIHKQTMAPQIKTVTTFHQSPPSIIIPQRESYENRPPTYVSTSPFSTSRVVTMRPLSPSPLSPYHSRVSRPL